MQLDRWLPGRFRRDRLVIPAIRLSGVITASGGGFRTTLSLATTASDLKRAFSYKKSPVVAISLNSPGGSPVQSRLIHQRIRQLAEKHKKRVLIFVEDVAASGGYMIALAGDEIIADETSIVGSIGVVAAGFGFHDAISRLGIERRIYTAGRNKVLLDPFQPQKESDIAHLKGLQKEIHSLFIEMVKEARGSRLADNKDIFSGLFWTGAQARELGLVDECGLMGQVLRERYGDQVRIKLVKSRRGLFGRPQPGIGSTGPAAERMGESFAAALPDGVIDALSERAVWARYGL